MKYTIPEISWHNRDPVLTVDFQYNSSGSLRRLATGGTDSHVLIWYVEIVESGTVKLEFAADLVRHNKAVNIVRFSPNGEMLASADDEAAIWIWKQDEKGAPDIFNDETLKENKENWVPLRTLRGHIEDVYDLCWSPNSCMMISGSVDNTAILWDVQKGRNMGILSDHKGFVQGVAWDPQNQYVASLCSDRFCRIYNINTKRAVFKIHKMNVKSDGDQPPKQHRMFHDDTLKSFCRRLTFTPDGELLITPAGCIELEEDKKLNVTYVFCRNSLNRPALYLPTNDKYTVAVRCCPVLFELRPLLKPATTGNEEHPWDKYSTMFCLPYRIVFAVATQDSVLLYDTQQPIPFAHISKIHYTRLSDLAWSHDGRILIVSSTDGYCSIITFTEEEIGIPYKEISEKTDKIEAKTEGQLSPETEMNSKKSTKAADHNPSPALFTTPIQIRSAKNSDKNRKIQLVTLSGPRVTEPKAQVKRPEELKEKNPESTSTNATSKTDITEDIKSMEIDETIHVEDTKVQKEISNPNQSFQPEEVKNVASSVKESEVKISKTENLKEPFLAENTVMDTDELDKLSKNDDIEMTDDNHGLNEETNDLKLVLELSNDEQTVNMSFKEKEIISSSLQSSSGISEEHLASDTRNKTVSGTTNKVPGRRVEFITLSSPKQNKKPNVQTKHKD